VLVTVVPGGARRQDSVAAGVRALSASAAIVVIHDAARAFVPLDVIRRTIDAAAMHGAAIAALPARDTVKRARFDGDRVVVGATLPREEIFLAQTPQAFRRDVLEAALEVGQTGVNATDEARLAEMAGFDVSLVEGDVRNIKVTTGADMELAAALAAEDPRCHEPPERDETRDSPAWQQGSPTSTVRVGFGYDSHRFVAGRPLILGGVRIPFGKGLLGHSDADAVAHAVTDAVLGAAALGDIGQHFPDDAPRWKDADSLELLALAAGHARELGYHVVNVDVTVIAEQPKLAPYRDAMGENIARALGIEAGNVSIKGKTNEGVDAAGRGEAIMVHAVALVGRDS
jgi:2-C-methyl-D-erythritol 4-phosphate cytidylyltransferase/2-C-methyl-D-erythritol 2,4-cyclodiphosphate synthase